MALLPDRSKDEDGNPIAGGIKTPATNLGLGGITLASATTVVVGWQTLFEKIFGDKVTEGTRKDVLIASMVVLGIIIVADLFSRAITSAAAERAQALSANRSNWVVSTVPAGLTATILEGADQTGCQVAALRCKPAEPEALEYLVIKAGLSPSWRKASALKFE